MACVTGTVSRIVGAAGRITTSGGALKEVARKRPSPKESEIAQKAEARVTGTVFRFMRFIVGTLRGERRWRVILGE